MSRNAERDAREALRRRERLLEAAFVLFAKRGIENVSLMEIAIKADVGPATLYKYYKNKPNLVIAVSAWIWGKVWDQNKGSQEIMEKRTAYDAVEDFCDEIIALYQERRDILRFSSNYKTYICQEGIPSDQLTEQNDALAPMREKFYEKFRGGQEDHSIRSDIPVQELFSVVMHTMLSMAERYALGLAWADNHSSNHVGELLYLKEMLLLWCSGKAEK